MIALTLYTLCLIGAGALVRFDRFQAACGRPGIWHRNAAGELRQ